MVILTAHVKDSHLFQDALLAFLTDAGLTVESQHSMPNDAGHVIIAAHDIGGIATSAPAVQASPVAGDPEVDQAPEPTPVEVAELPPLEVPDEVVGVPELTAGLDPSMTASPEFPPGVEVELPPTPTPAGAVVIKSLSTEHEVPFAFDPAKPESCLYVSDMEPVGEFVQFIFCGMLFKFPIERPEFQNIICNLNPQFSDTSIRVVTCIAGTDLCLPMLLKVVSNDGEGCAVVFGQDVAGALTPAMESLNDTSNLPTQ